MKNFLKTNISKLFGIFNFYLDKHNTEKQKLEETNTALKDKLNEMGIDITKTKALTLEAYGLYEVKIEFNKESKG
jgi:hypothetical protein